MQPHMPIWTQRLPADIRRRLELAVAAAVEARSDTHARQALNLVGVPWCSRLRQAESCRQILVLSTAVDDQLTIYSENRSATESTVWCTCPSITAWARARSRASTASNSSR